jgi:hypothetical protein
LEGLDDLLLKFVFFFPCLLSSGSEAIRYSYSL